jgi:hypothetical protein
MEKTFIERLEDIKDALPEERLEVLKRVAELNDPRDKIKREVIALMLEEKYNGSLDWLYSTLKRNRQRVKRRSIHVIKIVIKEYRCSGKKKNRIGKANTL